MPAMPAMAAMVPAWLRRYRRDWLPQDLVAGLVVAVRYFGWTPRER